MPKNRNLKHSDNWKTPDYFLEQIRKEFGSFFDPCPYNESDIIEDGLEIEWKDINFINPPYSRKLKEAFVKKGIAESKKGKLCIFLLPVSTSTKLFHDVIMPEKPEIRFVRGRLPFEQLVDGKFVNNGKGMHDSFLIIFDGRGK